MRFKLCIALAGIAVIGSPANEKKPAPTVSLHEVRVESDGREVLVTLAVFSEKDFRLRVINNPTEGTGPKYVTLVGAMRASGCMAGSNGGFFEQRPFAPVGLLLCNGQPVGQLNPTSWMRGVFAVRSQQASLESTDTFRASPDLTDAVQSGPWLVRTGRVETDNENSRMAPRTFICHDQRGNWALGASGPCTLRELAALLKDGRITSILDIHDALNLDGGPSTGLWCQRSEGNFYLQEKWAVRDYVGVMPREK